MSQYRFVTTAQNYSQLASGAVLHSAPGRPAFPVRLAAELFLRAYAVWAGEAQPAAGRCTLYDPCCGAAYLLTVLKLLFWEKIGRVMGSDLDGQALEIAARNLRLLTPAGMAARGAALGELAAQFGKQSHRDHLASARVLLGEVTGRAATQPAVSTLFQANALAGDALAAGLDSARVAGHTIDLVMTDVPYGETTAWSGSHAAGPHAATSALLSALRGVLGVGAVVVVAGLRTQMPAQEPAGYRRVLRMRIGRREARIWQTV